MNSISEMAANQGDDPPPPNHQSIEGLMNWFSSELPSLLNAHTMLAPITALTQAGNSEGPEAAYANSHQVHPEGITTIATTIVPFSDSAVPTMVILNLVPLHVVTDQYPLSLNPPPPLDQGGELSPFPPSHPSHLSVYYPMGGSDITINPRYDLEYATTPSGFPVVPRNSVPRPGVHGYQPHGHDGPIQETILNDPRAAVIASPDMAVHPPSFNQTLVAHLFSGHPLSSPLVNGGVIPTPTTHQDEGRQSTSKQLLCQTSTAGLIKGVVSQRPSRHQCTICDASYARLSGLNRHYKDKHMAQMACRNCKSKFSLGRMYKFTEHLQTCPSA